MGLDARKPAFSVCEQQRRRPACASAQSGQPLCYSLSVKYDSQTCCLQNFNILTSHCSRAGLFEPYFVGNSEDRFSCDKAHLYHQIRVCIGIIFFLFLNQNVLWVLKRTVPMRSFFYSLNWWVRKLFRG